MQTIKAAVCHAFGAPLQVEEVQLAAPAGTEVEVTLDAVAICHSDISYAEGAWGGSLPAVYGHEAAGRVSARQCDRDPDPCLWHLPQLRQRQTHGLRDAL